ncbi:interferon-induced protein 44-like [Exaiptasia diaphana]|uniref:Interferon-induced protein 44-like n=1 Tax=Exaiptasia diaphana TaxID=2652724 RepID=A0A913WSS3_EXADI|nr:interferon-induced protein 44-like [Exaiptasia diaphana]
MFDLHQSLKGFSGWEDTPAPEDEAAPSPFIDEPWRKIKGWGESTRKELKSEIQDLKPERFDVPTFNVILTGQIAAGKSSFYNSINSIFSNRVLPTKATSGEMGQSFTKQFKMYPFTHNANIRIGDTMGLDVNSSEVDIRNIFKILDGHVPNLHEFQSDEEFLPDNPDYILHPSLAERAHCVALVINANKLPIMQHCQVRKLKNLAVGIINRGIPIIVVLTHLDEFHPEVSEDIRKTYRSGLLKDLVVKLRPMLHGLPENLIFPVINYHKEVELDVGMDVLLLYALRSMIYAAECYLENLTAS